MGFEPGGRADKLGNRYEGRWVAKQLLRLLNEDVKFVTIESIGDDEKGVDLWIGKNNGGRQAQQCKARNSSKEFWPVGNLRSRDILTNLRYQLDRDPSFEFVFVSGIPVTQLADICESARNSNGNPEDFYYSQIKSVSRDRDGAYRQFCQTVGLNPDEMKDRARAFDYLRRSHFELYPYDDNSHGDLLTNVGFLLTGSPETVVATILAYVENNDRLGNPIYADELRHYLETQNIFPKYLTYDKRVIPAVERLQVEFEESIRPGLIEGALISRQETFNCLDAIKAGKMVILHGAVGAGKSGVLYELIQKLKDSSMIWLPIRLDRRTPKNTAAQFGEDLGLPDSPTLSLVAMAGDRSCVLVLDQLDAIRWTSAHSSNALDVCKELIRQVLSFKRANKDISVILSCRTFDLEHDPEIQQWIQSQNDPNWTKIEALPLPESDVRKVAGESFEGMTGRQRSILANPQNLAIWMEIHKHGDLPAFRSATELMKNFWQLRRRQMEKSGADANQINLIVTELVNWLEKSGKISAPARSLSRYSPLVIDLLKSHGIIYEQAGRVSFCHQSYLDFLIAERLITEIENGENILTWLGPKEKQTLFRREQLRQAMTLFLEESPSEFLTLVKQILMADEIRFNLKHVALELIGQMDQVSSAIADYCLTLLDEDFWRLHVVDTILYRHKTFILMLINQNIIGDWLNSDLVEDVELALRLLSSVAEKIPDEVTEVLIPWSDSEEVWLNRILGVISWQIVNDSKKMFELRIKLARRGYFSDFIDWKALCERYPSRAIQLIEALVSTLALSERNSSETDQRKLFEELSQEDVQALKMAAEHSALETLNLLLPHVERLTIFDETDYDPRINDWHRDELMQGTTTIERILIELLIKAGETIAKKDSQLLLNIIENFKNSKSVVIQEILINIFPHLSEQNADVGVNWLIKDPLRLQLGSGNYESEWMPAERLVRALSPFCSDTSFEKLEYYLVHYHAPDEKRRAGYILPLSKRGIFGHYWGHAQYFLLPALAPDRISKMTSDLIVVLNRKFTDCPEVYYFQHDQMLGGIIGSKLDKNLERISDHAWLKIIENRQVPMVNYVGWEQISNDYAVSSSTSQFSQSLGTIARIYPERFGRLALQFPPETHPRYVSVILNAMEMTKPAAELEEDKRLNWEPTSAETVFAVLNNLDNLNDRDVAIAFCRLVRERALEDWPDSVIEKLLYLATNHPDLEPGKLNISCDKTPDEASIDTLFQNTINCVRGVAAGAIARLLWEHSDQVKKLESGLEALVRDSHPVIRMAVVEALIPLINIDRKKAVTLFCLAVEKDVRVAASHYAQRFMNWTIYSNPEELTVIIREMIRSERPEVSSIGAQAAIAYNLFYGLFEQESCLCFIGTTSQRIGIARVAANFIKDGKYSAKCRKILAYMFNDPEKEVRSEASRAFSLDNFLQSHENIELAKIFIKSKAFIEQSYGLFRCLKKSKESLAPLSELILEICGAVAEAALENTDVVRSRLRYLITETSPLLLRLYEQTENEYPEIAVRCLDAWDLLFEKLLGNAKTLIAEIEK